MKNATSILLLTILFSSALCNHAHAADPKDVAKVVELMYLKSTTGIIDKEVYDDGGIQIVFITDNLRYTLYHSGDEQVNFLSVWVRPNGTSNRDVLQTFTDDDLDGQINFGICEVKGTLSVRKCYGLKTREEACGNEYRDYWQQIYDKAITDALNALKDAK